MFGSSTVRVGLRSHCCVAAPSHVPSCSGYRHLCSSTDWGTDLQNSLGTWCIFHLSQLTGWLHRYLYQQVQGTTLEMKQATEKTGRKGIGQDCLSRHCHEGNTLSSSFKKTQKRAALQFLQQTTQKTYICKN